MQSHPSIFLRLSIGIAILLRNDALKGTRTQQRGESSRIRRQDTALNAAQTNVLQTVTVRTGGLNEAGTLRIGQRLREIVVVVVHVTGICIVYLNAVEEAGRKRYTGLAEGVCLDDSSLVLVRRSMLEFGRRK